MQNLLDLLGVIEHHWLDYNDGFLEEISVDEAVSTILDIIGDIQPDTIVTFEPDGITGHDDHKAVHRWAVALQSKLVEKPQVMCAFESMEFYEKYGAKLGKQHNIYFNIDKPNLVSRKDADYCVELDELHRLRKYQAIAAHTSQTSEMFATQEGRVAIRCLCEYECFMLTK